MKGVRSLIRVIRDNFVASIAALRESPALLVRAIALPATLAVITQIASVEDSSLATSLGLVGYATYVAIAVRTHRHILLGRDGDEAVSLLANYLRFAVWGLVIAVIGGLLCFPIILAASFVPASVFFLIAFFIGAFLPAVYVMARLSLLLPDRAIGQATPLEVVWTWSDRNGWNLVGALYLMPFVLILAISGLTYKTPDYVRNVVAATTYVPMVVFQVALLSVAYRDLKARYQASHQAQE